MKRINKYLKDRKSARAARKARLDQLIKGQNPVVYELPETEHSKDTFGTKVIVLCIFLFILMIFVMFASR